MSDTDRVHIGLNIDDTVNAVVIELRPYQDEEGRHIAVAAGGYEASAEGAKAVVATLLVAAQAIAQELDIDIDDMVVDKPKKRPMFNPRPAGGRGK